MRADIILRKNRYSGVNKIFEISVISGEKFSQIAQILFEIIKNQRYLRERVIERIGKCERTLF